ncbi:MAG: PH domain-containing protein [Flavitalea sp.]
MTTFKSKQGLELSIPLSIFLGVGIAVAYTNRIWTTLAILGIVIVFISYVFVTTYYQVNGNMLRVKCGFIIDKNVDIRTILSIRETYIPLSAPATSLDRLELKFNKGKDSVLVSPEDKQGFIAALLAVNPTIAVDYRKNRKK